MKIEIDMDLEDRYRYLVPLINPEFEFIRIDEIRKNFGSNNIVIKHIPCGRIFDIQYGNFVTRRTCKHCSGDKWCRYDLQSFIDKFNRERDDSDEYEILSYNGMANPLLAYHKACGKTFTVRADSLIYCKSKCPCVYGKSHYRHTFELLDKRIKETDSEYELVSAPNNEIRVLKDHVEIRHIPCGTVFTCIPHNFISYNKKRCPKCKVYPKNLIGYKDSKGVKIIEKWIKEHHIYYEREKTFDGLVAPSSGRKLRYDFYIPDLNLIIEFDGKQHFDVHESSLFTKEKYDKIRLHDKLKNKFCEKKGIYLIRISYFNASKEYIYKVLDKFFKKEVRIYCMIDYK